MSRTSPSAHTTHPTEESGVGGVNPVAVIAPGVVPENILHDDEVVLLLTKPSLFFILYISLPFMAVAFLAGVVLVQFTQSWSQSFFSPPTVAAVTVLVCLGRLLWGLLVWTSHIYMLTNQRIVTIKGVVNVHMFQTHLRKIQKTELYRPLSLRVVGTGTIGFATAASDLDSTWVMIARPVDTHEQVVAAINRMQSK